jgi:hypothetical protein
MKLEGHSHIGSVESRPPACENLVHRSHSGEQDKNIWIKNRLTSDSYVESKRRPPSITKFVMLLELPHSVEGFFIPDRKGLCEEFSVIVRMTNFCLGVPLNKVSQIRDATFVPIFALVQTKPSVRR